MDDFENRLYKELLECCGDDYHELKATLERMLERCNQDLEELQALIDEDLIASGSVDPEDLPLF